MYRAHDQTELLGVVNRLGTYLASHLNVRVVVLDSIAFHFRQDLQSSNNRARYVFCCFSSLKGCHYTHVVLALLLVYAASTVCFIRTLDCCINCVVGLYVLTSMIC